MLRNFNVDAERMGTPGMATLGHARGASKQPAMIRQCRLDGRRLAWLSAARGRAIVPEDTDKAMEFALTAGFLVPADDSYGTRAEWESFSCAS